MKGRKPTPSILRLISGNPSRRPMNDAEPVPAEELHAPPENMTDAQKAIWRNAIANAPRGLLRSLDTQLLSVWVVASDLHAHAMEQITKYGAMVKSPVQGMPMQSPYVSILNNQAQIIMKAASELGFSPTSRSRISVASPSKNQANRFANNAASKS